MGFSTVGIRSSIHRRYFAVVVIAVTIGGDLRDDVRLGAIPLVDLVRGQDIANGSIGIIFGVKFIL
jgi:hypothetical protein